MKNSMKAIFTLLLGVLFVYGATAADKDSKAISRFGASVFTSKTGQVMLNIDKYNNSTTAILLEDANGNVV
jgi:hypothetical protein